MRKLYFTVLKKHFCSCLLHSRASLGLTQSKMGERLAMDERSYIDLEHGKSCCSAVTLAMYLVYLCSDVERFLEELRHAFEAEVNRVA